MVRWPRGELSTYTCEMEGFGYLDLVGSLHGDIGEKCTQESSVLLQTKIDGSC